MGELRVGEVSMSKPMFNAIATQSYSFGDTDTRITINPGQPISDITDKNALEILSNDIAYWPMLIEKLFCGVEIYAYRGINKHGSSFDETSLLIQALYVRLDNALRYFIGDAGLVDFGVYSFRMKLHTPFTDNVKIVSDPKTYKRSDFKPVDIDALFSDSRTRRFFGEMFLIQNTEMKKRLCVAIDWVGQSFFQVDPATAFVECAFALEALLQVQDGYVDKGISAQLSEYCAFILGHDYESRRTVEKEVRDLYGTRSKIAHGSIKDKIDKDVDRVRSYAILVINAFLDRPTLQEMKTKHDLKDYVDLIRLS